MTEKQYTTDYYNFVRDDKTYIKDNNVRMTYEQIVDLLNNLTDENEQLKKDLKKKFVPFAKADGDYTTVNTEEFIKILNENEQLNQELKSFRPLYFESENGVTTLYEKVKDD